MKYNAKQKILIDLLLSSPTAFARCCAIIKSEYFDPELRKHVDFILRYHKDYSAIPSSEIIAAETGIAVEIHQLTPDEEQYCCDETEKFCRKQAVIRAIQSAPAKINDEDYGAVENAIRDAISISLDTDLGVDYFSHPLGRLEAQAETLERVPTKIKALDAAINGGLVPGETILVTANSGGGKSVTLSNFAINWLEQKLDVLYVSLELSEELIAQRFDTMFTGVKSVIAHQKIPEIAATLVTLAPTHGKLTIKRFSPGINANNLRAYLKEYYIVNEKYPDVLVLDYLDRFGTIEKLSASNISQRDGAAADEFYELGIEFKMIQATASQQNREAIDAPEASQTHIQGGLTKINPMDVVAAIQLTPTLKAQGEMVLSLIKTRSSDGVGTAIVLGWDNDRLRIVNIEKQSSSNMPVSKFVDRAPAQPPIQKPRRSLVDLID